MTKAPGLVGYEWLAVSQIPSWKHMSSAQCRTFLWTMGTVCGPPNFHMGTESVPVLVVDETSGCMQGKIHSMTCQELLRASFESAPAACVLCLPGFLSLHWVQIQQGRLGVITSCSFKPCLATLYVLFFRVLYVNRRLPAAERPGGNCSDAYIWFPSRILFGEYSQLSHDQPI